VIPARVVGISGPVGAGKSTLVEGMARAVADCSTIHFDHYETVTAQPIESIREWMKDGADMQAIALPQLERDLAQLKSGFAVTDPMTRMEIPSRRLIFFETQFGRKHAQTGKHIDFLIWIDTPLDIALARKLRQFSVPLETLAASDRETFVPWLARYLDNYLGVVGELLRMQRDTVGAQADLMLDGNESPEGLVRLAAEAVTARFG
jgi:predicted kinase